MENIYAIARNAQDGTLSLKEFPVKLERELSDDDIWGYIDYATHLSSSYTSNFPLVKVTDRNNQRDYEDRKNAIAFNETIIKAKETENVVAYSHRYGGWKKQEWKYNEDIKFSICTNFGYGSVAYFFACYSYKGTTLVPYRHYIMYRFAMASDIMKYTYIYPVEYNYWKNLMEDTISFYNAVTQKQEHAIFKWIERHLHALIWGLRDLLVYSSFKIYHCSSLRYKNSKQYETVVEGDELICLKAEKISGAVEFVKNIKVLPAEVTPERYTEQLNVIFKDFLVWVQKPRTEFKNKLEELQKQEKEMLKQPIVKLYNDMQDDPLLGHINPIESWYTKKSIVKEIRIWFTLKEEYEPSITNNDIRILIKQFEELIKQVEGNQYKEGLLRIWLKLRKEKGSSDVIEDIETLVPLLNRLSENKLSQLHNNDILNVLITSQIKVEDYFNSLETEKPNENKGQNINQ